MRYRTAILVAAFICPTVVLAAVIATSTDTLVLTADTGTTTTRSSTSLSEPAVSAPGADATGDASSSPQATTSQDNVDQSSSSISSTDTATAKSVSALEDDYFKKNGIYLQILPGNALPDYEAGSVLDALGSSIPDGASVIIYESPAGKGLPNHLRGKWSEVLGRVWP